MEDVVIIGGGLAGLFNAILLNKAGFKVTVIEKKRYPFHRVCGEYVSNEVLPLLNALEIYPEKIGAASINTLNVSAITGNSFTRELKLGGFGISRYLFDHYLFERASKEGVTFIQNTRADDISFNGAYFKVITSCGELQSKLVIGAFGKRSNLDQKLNSAFFHKRSPYLAVKYHIKTAFPANEIQLHNFKNGYCGINRVENYTCCLCYLVHRKELKKRGNISLLEKEVLHENPHLRRIFTTADFLWQKPEVINEISFEKKLAVNNHILMSGDTAGMITPLCGNGMSMAIHSARILTQSIVKFYNPNNNFTASDRHALEQEYTENWNMLFSNRLFAGRQLQKLFGNNVTTNIAISILKTIPPLADFLINKTHGEPFN